MGSFSILAVAEMPERSMVRKIVGEFRRRYQFSNVRVTLEGTGRNGIKAPQNCDLLLIGLKTARASGSRALLLSSCPCVVWTEAWDHDAVGTVRRRPYMEYRITLLLAGKLGKNSSSIPKNIRSLLASKRSRLPFEYRAALGIMRILLDKNDTDQPGGHCPC